jgi:hypothetical protein
VVKDQINQTPIAGAMVSLPEWGMTAETNGEGCFHHRSTPRPETATGNLGRGLPDEMLEETLTGEISPRWKFNSRATASWWAASPTPSRSIPSRLRRFISEYALDDENRRSGPV